MDTGVTPRSDAAIDKAARDLGVIPGDPAYPFVQGMRALIAEHRSAVEGQLTELRAIVSRQPDEHMMRGILFEFIRQSWDKWLDKFDAIKIATCVAVIMGAFGVGYGVCWWTTPPQDTWYGTRNGPEECEPVQGGKVCRIPMFVVDHPVAAPKR